MTNYAGSRCPVCEKKFLAEDDVVVCPTCGAPHHRECYHQLGECAFEKEHMTGKAWRSSEAPAIPPSQPRSQQPGRPPEFFQSLGDQRRSRQADYGKRVSENGERVCSSCGSINPSSNLFCNLCGNWLGEKQGQPQNPFPFPGIGNSQDYYGPYVPPNFEQQMQFDPKIALYGGLSPEEKIGNFTVRDYASFVGKSSSYYLPRFKAVADNNRGFSLSFSAFIFHFLYFFYRKMYAVGAVLMAVFILSSIPTIMTVNEQVSLYKHAMTVGVDEEGNLNEPYNAEDMARLEHYSVISSRSSYLFFFVKLLTSLFATRLYYEHATRKMTKAMESVPESEKKMGRCLTCENTLGKAGGINKTLVIVGATIPSIAALVYLLIQTFR